MQRIETGGTDRRRRRTVTGGVDRRTVLRGIVAGTLLGRVGVGAAGASPTPTGPVVVGQVDGSPAPTPAPDGSVTARSAVESLSEGLEEFVRKDLTGAPGIRAQPVAFVTCGAAADGPHVDGPYSEFVSDTNFLFGILEEANLQAEAVALVPDNDASLRDAHAGAVSWAAMRAVHDPDGRRRLSKSEDYREWWASGRVHPESGELGTPDQSGRRRLRPRGVRLRNPPTPVGVITRARETDGRVREDGLSHAIAAGTVFGGYLDRLDTVWHHTDTRPPLQPANPTDAPGGTDGEGKADGTNGAAGNGEGDENDAPTGEESSDERIGAVDRATDRRVTAADPGSRLVATVALSPDVLPGDGGVARVDLGHSYVLIDDAPDGGSPVVFPLRASFDAPIGPDDRQRTTASTGALDGMWSAFGRELRAAAEERGLRSSASVSSPGSGERSTVITVVGASLELRPTDGSEGGNAATGLRFEHGEGAYEARIVAPPGADPGYVPTLAGMEIVGGDGSRIVGAGGDLTGEDRQVFDGQWTGVGDAATGGMPVPIGIGVAVEGSLVDAVNRVAANPATPLGESFRESSPGDAIRVTGWFVEEWADQSITVDTGWITPAQMAWAADLVNSRADEIPSRYRSLVRDGWVNVRFEAGEGDQFQSYAALVRDRRVVDVAPGARGDAWLDASVDLDAANEIVGSSRPGRTAGIAYESDRIRLEGRGLVNRLGVGLVEIGLTVSRTLSGLSRGFRFGRPERRGAAEPATGEEEGPDSPLLG
jgi:hypothetical protein